jgi:ABC-2 type transport system permease protein
MLRSVFAKSLRDVRRSFLWWSVGIVGLVAMIVAVYPSVRDNPGLNKLVEDYPEALKAFIAFGGAVDYASPAGYLGSELFSFMLPLVFLLALVGRAAAILAGEEEAGTLESLLANPISRRRLVLEKLGALVAEAVGLGGVLWLSLVVGTRIAGMEVGALRLAAASVAALLLALAFGTVAFAIGAATGHRARAIAVTAALAVASYLVNGLAPLVDALDPFQKLSLFFHYAASDPLRSGLDGPHVAVLVLVAVVASAVSPFLFERRDIHA